MCALSVLGTDEVHVWSLRLVDGSLSDLDESERSRAARFRFATDRSRFVAAHSILRRILAGYLQARSADLRFHHNPWGKPCLRGSDLRFNLSHSGEWGIVALARGAEIGADVEKIPGRSELFSVAERFFSRREVSDLNSLPSEGSPRGFAELWTRKEAYVKARGLGLSIPLDRFEMSLGIPARVLRADLGSPEDWFVHSLDPAPGYVAAVVTLTHPSQVRHYSWSA